MLEIKFWRIVSSAGSSEDPMKIFGEVLGDPGGILGGSSGDPMPVESSEDSQRRMPVYDPLRILGLSPEEPREHRKS